MKTILAVIAETDHETVTLPTLECVEEGRDIADALAMTVHVFLPCAEPAPDTLLDKLAAHGADRITILAHPALARGSADGWLAALEPSLQAAQPHLILAPDSSHIRSWLPRLSVQWRVPMASGCIQVKASGDGVLELTRPTHRGAHYEHLRCPGASTVLATLTPGVRGIGAARRRSAADIDVIHETPALEPETWRDRALRILPANPRTVDLSEAERIVCGGLGIDGPAGVAKLQALADLLNAALGGTRVIADRGWLDPERFIGTTGKIVAPKLYIAFGVSGAGQHISGITESETIILVNTDRTAPLFNIADLGVVADLHQVLPVLIEKLHQSNAVGTHAASVPDQEVSQVM